MADTTAEQDRLAQDAARTLNWKRWGPYLSERQWGTVREDYSADGDAWNYLPMSSPQPRLSLGRGWAARVVGSRVPALLRRGALEWTRPDSQGAPLRPLESSGQPREDVKECYFYLDSTPTHSYAKASTNIRTLNSPTPISSRKMPPGKLDREYEIQDTGLFDEGRTLTSLSSTPKRVPTIPASGLQSAIAARTRPPSPAPAGLVPQYLDLGCTYERAAGSSQNSSSTVPPPSPARTPRSAISASKSDAYRLALHGKRD